MDKNLNSSPKLPRWLSYLQIVPLIVHLVNEVISRYYGTDNLSDQEDGDSPFSIPAPLDVNIDPKKES